MTNLQLSEFQAWLDKAQGDFLTAQKLASGDDPMIDTAVYHVQQSAEKSLKAYLVLLGIRPPKTHDIGVLISLLDPKNRPPFISDTQAEELTTLGTLYRYPGHDEHASSEEFELGLETARQLLVWVKSQVVL